MNPPALPHMPAIPGTQLPPSKYANAYSSSGFDMLGVLVRKCSFATLNPANNAVDEGCNTTETRN